MEKEKSYLIMINNPDKSSYNKKLYLCEYDIKDKEVQVSNGCYIATTANPAKATVFFEKDKKLMAKIVGTCDQEFEAYVIEEYPLNIKIVK